MKELTDERDGLNAKVKELTDERVGLLAQVEELTDEWDRLFAKVEELTDERNDQLEPILTGNQIRISVVSPDLPKHFVGKKSDVFDLDRTIKICRDWRIGINGGYHEEWLHWREMPDKAMKKEYKFLKGENHPLFHVPFGGVSAEHASIYYHKKDEFIMYRNGSTSLEVM